MKLKVELNGNWRVSMAEAKDYPCFYPVDTFSGPCNAAVPGKLPDFSGTLRYETEFELRPVFHEKTYLDMGEAYEIAEVWMNGDHAGIRINPPYLLDISDLIVEGTNTLMIDVTNTLAKSAGNNTFDRAMPQEPSGLIGPVRILTPRQALR